ncbi:hypothetical protein ANAPC5_01339 [Anaplasma phagocytophilum]|nr:hypothetical protein ANAPC5_01339 [Anaplasma phagocytophilum]
MNVDVVFDVVLQVFLDEMLSQFTDNQQEWFLRQFLICWLARSCLIETAMDSAPVAVIPQSSLTTLDSGRAAELASCGTDSSRASQARLGEALTSSVSLCTDQFFVYLPTRSLQQQQQKVHVCPHQMWALFVRRNG